MPSDPPIQGTDTSKYQPTGTYPPGAFEIINAGDPYLQAKVDKNRAEGRPTDAYVWIYPGGDPTGPMQRALSFGLRRQWADYEQDGVTPGDLDRFFAVADSMGLQSGYYANPGRVPNGPYLARPYWMAQYPWPNSGAWPGWAKMTDPGRPVQIWQYSSSDGTLDVDAIADEAWWQQWCGGTAPPKPTEEENVSYWRMVQSKDHPPLESPWYITWLHPELGERVKKGPLTADEAADWRAEVLSQSAPLLFDPTLAPQTPYQVDDATLAAYPVAPPYPPPSGGGGSGGNADVDRARIAAAQSAIDTAQTAIDGAITEP